MKPGDATQQGRLELLERTLLELGGELFSLKATLARSQQAHEQFLGIVKGLKLLLDEKGLITLDDFEAAVELGAALEPFGAAREAAAAGATAVDVRGKKSGH